MSKEKLNFPIVFSHKCEPDALQLLVKGSKGHVSVFYKEEFFADHWTKEAAKEFIKDGVWIVISSGNVTYKETR